MSLYLSMDTSNYTTSVAVYDTDSKKVIHRKQLLPVKPGEKGIRQSDAVFHHTRQLSPLIEDLMSELNLTYGETKYNFSAIGVSNAPRRVEGSYMPCFTVGTGTAHALASVMGIPCYEFSHQEGHVAAALYSADRLDLIGKDFLAFHVSGGTTESLFVTKGTDRPYNIKIIGTSNDLKAGQAIDRVGVMLGLSFPCGPELEKLALTSKMTYKIKPSINGNDCSLSGVENKCRKMFDEGCAPEDIAMFCLSYIEASLSAMATNLSGQYPGLHIVFSGGVMSNSIIRNNFLKTFDCSFAAPEFSSDNAAGIAILASKKEK